MVQKKLKISFCTVCMNRLHHLRQTLPQNIENNIAYGNIEFIILNYNSKDEIDEWIKTEMSEYIESGILVYYKTTEPEIFQMSHSKNVAARCATGDIICNIDADNFTGKDFADFVNQKFIENDNVFLTTDMTDSIKDCCGRICVKYDDFHKIRGYDENMKSYGFEDEDLKNRLQFILLTKLKIDARNFLTAIRHYDEERLAYDKTSFEIEEVYIKRVSYASFIILYLLKNSEYYIGEVLKNRAINSQSIDNLFLNKKDYEYDYSLVKDEWTTGKWRRRNNKLILENFKNEMFFYKRKETKKKDGECYSEKINNSEFIKISDPGDMTNSTMFFSQITNRNKMKKNIEKRLTVVNCTSYGKAILVKNFIQDVQIH